MLALAAWLSAAAVEAQTARFRRGDANADGAVDVADAVHLLEHLFRDGPEPSCADAAEGNDSGDLDLSDPVLILIHLFGGSPGLPAPGGVNCGFDPTADALGCSAYPCPGGLSALSDDFEGTALDPSWSLFRPELVQITVADGALSLEPDQYALWFNASRGPLVYRLVTGDFRVTARVHARRKSDLSLPPAIPIHLGGLMARNPAGDGAAVPENYVFIVLGQDEVDRSIETKTTTNSSSVYQGPAWPTGDAELRICRRGATLLLLQRAIGQDAWTTAASYQRPDLPAELQVGPVVYAAA